VGCKECGQSIIKRGEGIDFVLGLEKFSKNEDQNMEQH
jgi:hypothetical protein